MIVEQISSEPREERKKGSPNGYGSSPSDFGSEEGIDLRKAIFVFFDFLPTMAVGCLGGLLLGFVVSFLRFMVLDTLARKISRNETSFVNLR